MRVCHRGPSLASEVSFWTSCLYFATKVLQINTPVSEEDQLISVSYTYWKRIDHCPQTLISRDDVSREFPFAKFVCFRLPVHVFRNLNESPERCLCTFVAHSKYITLYEENFSFLAFIRNLLTQERLPYNNCYIINILLFTLCIMRCSCMLNKGMTTCSQTTSL